MAQIQEAIFWIETDKIKANPYQPRREFDEDRLNELKESVQQYGILQPLVVSRNEKFNEDTGELNSEYELIAGERRLRASKLAGLKQVPVVIRVGDTDREKLELAIIENLQREDLNPVERASSFQRLADEFKLTWTEVGKKVGKSREYVSNTVRILMLPQDILDAISKKLISEGHTRPLLMLIDRPDEMMTLFKEMLMRKMTVREAEAIARRVAYEKVRKKAHMTSPEVIDMEEKMAESLGTRVHIEPREKGGKILIDYFTYEELLALTNLMRQAGEKKNHVGMLDKIKEENASMLSEKAANGAAAAAIGGYVIEDKNETLPSSEVKDFTPTISVNTEAPVISTNDNATIGDAINYGLATINDEAEVPEDDRSIEEIKEDENEDMDLYNIKNFSL